MPGIAFEADFGVARAAVAGAALVEHVLGPRDVVLVDHQAVMLSQQFFAAVAEQAFDAVVDEGESAFAIQRVDEVGRTVDQEAVPLFRLLQALQDVVVFLFQPAPRQRVVDAAQQFLGFVRLAHEVGGAAAQRTDRRVDGAVAGHHDDRRIGAAVGDEAQHLVAVEVRHAKVEQDGVELLLADGDQGVASAACRHHVVIARGQQSRQPFQDQRLVVHHQKARTDRKGADRTALRGGYDGIVGHGCSPWARVTWTRSVLS